MANEIKEQTQHCIVKVANKGGKEQGLDRGQSKVINRCATDGKQHNHSKYRERRQPYRWWRFFCLFNNPMANLYKVRFG